ERLDDRSDVYSLGASYFKLLTGRAPYVADTPLQVLFAHCEKSVPDPRMLAPDTPDDCATILQRSMAKEPSDRFQTRAAFLAAVNGLMGKALVPETTAVPAESNVDQGADQPTVALEDGLSAPARSTSGKRGLLIAALAGLILIVAVAFILLNRS